MLTKRIFITLFKDIYQTKGKRCETTVADCVDGLKTPERLCVTASEYGDMPDEEKKKLKFGGEVYALSTYEGDLQTGAKDAKAYGITLDVDEADTQLPEILKKHFPETYMFVHTTFSSREYKFDEAGFRINQKMLIPRVLKDVKYHYYEWGTGLLDVDTFSSDKTECEHRFRGCRGGFSAKAPLTGPIDAYNEAHPIKEIMESLSDIYEATDTENRYKMIGSDSTPGMIIDPEKNIATSFHANDPAQGKSLNSFDLYRIHRFGELDKDCPRDTKKNELPSFKAMLDLAKKDNKVQKLLAEHREKLKHKKAPTKS